MRETIFTRLLVEAAACGVRLEPDGDSILVFGDAEIRKEFLKKWRDFIVANREVVLETLKEKREGKVSWIGVADAIVALIEENPPAIPVEYQDDWWYFLVDGLGALAERGIDWELYDRIAQAVNKGKRWAMLERAWAKWKEADRGRQRAIDASQWDLAYERGNEAGTWALRGLMVELAKLNGPGVREANLRPWVCRPYADWLWQKAKNKNTEKSGVAE